MKLYEVTLTWRVDIKYEPWSVYLVGIFDSVDKYEAAIKESYELIKNRAISVFKKDSYECASYPGRECHRKDICLKGGICDTSKYDMPSELISTTSEGITEHTFNADRIAYRFITKEIESNKCFINKEVLESGFIG